MIAALALATCLAAGPPALALDGARLPAERRGGLAQDEEGVPPYGDEEDEESGPRLFLSAWGGEAFDAGGTGRGSALLGGEVSYALHPLDLGVAAYGYRNLVDATHEWAPVLLLKLTQRFRTQRGVEAAFGFGVGAGRPDDWMAWFQVSLGVRVSLGPVFLGGELAFEQYDLLRLAAGLGVAF